MYEKLMPKFQKFLISRKLATLKTAPFYAYWVNGFSKFADSHPELSAQAQKEKFLELLQATKIEDWQMQQVKEAIRLYSEQFLKQVSALEENTSPGEAAKAEFTVILDKMRDSIRVKHFSYSTERTYIDWANRFLGFVSKTKNKDVQPQALTSEDVRGYLTYLAVEKRVSSSTQNQAFNALLFLFREILKIELKDLGNTVRAKRGPKLPVVLSVKEVQELFKYLEGKELLIVQLIYGTGLRLMELSRLRVQDIDFDNNLVFVRASKGDKDRTTIMPQVVKDALRVHLQAVEELHKKDLKQGFGEVYLPDAVGRKYPGAAKEWRWQYVFPAAKLSVDPRSAKVRRHHIGSNTVQKIVAAAVKRANIAKHASVHTLRHSFATHLLMDGVNIREIQELLGHKNVETTMIYTHVMRDMSNAPSSPLDRLYEK